MRRVDSIYRRSADRVTLPTKQTKRSFGLGRKILLALSLVVALSASSFAGELNDLIALSRLLYGGRYLVLFQNNAELRPTGGFLGSFAVVEMGRGKIKSFTVEGNIYQQDNQFIETHKIPAPPPFQKIWPGSLMALNSANWSPDFSTAAQTVQWYYDKEYQARVDGVIALNSTLIGRLVGITGPLELSAQNLYLTEQNFLATLQQYVEQDYYQTPDHQDINKPKSVIGDLMPVLFEKLPRSNPLKLAALVKFALQTHEIQLYFNDRAKQTVVESRNWSAEVPHWNGDYLYINNANLGGGKGSLEVDQQVRYEAQANPDGSKDVVLRIVRLNRGRQDYPVADNLNYTRVIVPLGSKLYHLEVDGYDILGETEPETEFERTIFGFWFDTAVGQRKEAVLTYRVPPLSESKLWLQRQPGAPEDSVRVTVNGLQILSEPLRTSRILDIL